jgi:UDP-GlcNAc:undecaprenyl-phosphate GlcNAc-1-phosphate transferase
MNLGKFIMNILNDFQVSIYVASIIAFILSGLFCFLVLNFYKNYNFKNSSQKRLNSIGVIPLGGVAMAISFFISVRLLGEADPKMVNISIFALSISILGVLDDFYELSWRLKILFQFIFVGVPIFIFEQTINIEFLLRVDVNNILNFIFTTIWVITLMNAINFIDNMDGFAAVNCMFICIAITLLSFISNQNYLADVSLILFFCLLGFLIFNFPPAKIYMGDSGSLFVGFIFGFISILFSWNPSGISGLYNSITPVFLFFTIPLLDFLTVFVYRIRNNIPPTTGGTDHISHRLLNRGYTIQNIIFIFITMNLFVFMIIGVTIQFDKFANIAFIIYFVSIISIFVKFQNMKPLD